MTFRTIDRPALDAVVARHDSDRDVQDAVGELLHWREQHPRVLARCGDLFEENRALRGIITLRWKRMAGNLPMPRRARPGEAGHDLAVMVDPSLESGAAGYTIDDLGPMLKVYPGALVPFRSGWAVEIPPSQFGLVKVRSSIGKFRWILASSGVIDPTYRGEISVPMLYLGDEPYHVRPGDRMAQMMIVPRPLVDDIEVDTLSPSPRGDGSFGSTGR